MSGFYVDVDEMLNMINKVVYEELERAPLPDVREVKHAHWIVDRDEGTSLCSSCYTVFDDRGDDIPDYWNYCPECGAIMDGGEHNETRTDL